MTWLSHSEPRPSSVYLAHGWSGGQTLGGEAQGARQNQRSPEGTDEDQKEREKEEKKNVLKQRQNQFLQIKSIYCSFSKVLFFWVP